jgi:hypothetical protein
MNFGGVVSAACGEVLGTPHGVDVPSLAAAFLGLNGSEDLFTTGPSEYDFTFHGVNDMVRQLKGGLRLKGHTNVLLLPRAAGGVMADEVKARWARGYYSAEFLTALRWPGAPLLSRPLLSGTGRPIVAMHVRRGDMSLGCERCRDRTTPDGWNLWALRQVLRALPGADVHVFSSLEGRHTPEEFDCYREAGASVHLDDGEILAPWAYFARADVAVLARSSFSWAPAMLNTNCVVFQKNPRLAPVPGWIEARNQWGAEETWEEGLDSQTLTDCIARVSRGRGATR